MYLAETLRKDCAVRGWPFTHGRDHRDGSQGHWHLPRHSGIAGHRVGRRLQLASEQSGDCLTRDGLVSNRRDGLPVDSSEADCGASEPVPSVDVAAIPATPSPAAEVAPVAAPAAEPAQNATPANGVPLTEPQNEAATPPVEASSQASTEQQPREAQTDPEPTAAESPASESVAAQSAETASPEPVETIEAAREVQPPVKVLVGNAPGSSKSELSFVVRENAPAKEVHVAAARNANAARHDRGGGQAAVEGRAAADGDGGCGVGRACDDTDCESGGGKARPEIRFVESGPIVLRSAGTPKRGLVHRPESRIRFITSNPVLETVDSPAVVAIVDDQPEDDGVASVEVDRPQPEGTGTSKSLAAGSIESATKTADSAVVKVAPPVAAPAKSTKLARSRTVAHLHKAESKPTATAAAPPTAVDDEPLVVEKMPEAAAPVWQRP